MFYKIAKVESVASATFDVGTQELHRIARATDAGNAAELGFVAANADAIPPRKSYYLDGARKIDVAAKLKEASTTYDISPHPSDYIYEAIRANSVNVPNDNHDSFSKSELLRFDVQKKKAVYLTYEGKPHHLNHQAANPKRARGVILDAHYNADSPALENCPTCNHRTAEETERDPSGIHCSKCGSVVKDEFVEILVAVDTKKDAALIRGIQAGLLNAGSMGCSCSSTVCNVCDHVARTVQDFCEHIRGSSKGSLWLRQGSKFKRTTADEVRALMKKSGLNSPRDPKRIIDVYLRAPGADFEIRKAFEYCQGVEFDEYSRVHKPADPKAHTIELLKAASAHSGADVSTQTLEQETEQLLNWARLAQLEQSMPNGTAHGANAVTASASSNGARAGTFYVVRVNGNDEDVHVGSTLKQAAQSARLGSRDIAEYTTVSAATASQAVVRATKSAQYLPIQGDVMLTVPDGMQVHFDQNGQPMMGPKGPQQLGPDGQPMPGGPGGPGAGAPGGPGTSTSIEDMTQQEMHPGEEQSPEEFGMLPPGAEGHEQHEGEAEKPSPYAAADDAASEEHMDEKYASVYGDFEVDVTADGASLMAPSGEVFSVKAGKTFASDDARMAFGNELLNSVTQHGLVRTALKYKAEFSKRFADSTEGATFNWEGGYPASSGGALEGAMEPQTETHQPGKDVVVSGGATDGAMDDLKNETRPMPSNSIESRDTNMQDEAELASPKDHATDGAETVNRETYPTYKPSDDALHGGVSDMEAQAGVGPGGKRADAPRETPSSAGSAGSTQRDVTAAAKVVEERLNKLNASRVARLKEEHAAELAAVTATMNDRWARALKIAARRSMLNIETSPLKAKMLDSLTVPRPIGRSAATGQQMQYTGVDETLGLHLVEAAWAESAEEEVDHLINRAAEIMTYDDKYLVSIEKDISKQAAVIPQVFAEQQLEPVTEPMRRAASLREDLSRGNMNLAPGNADSGATGNDRVSVIRAALGPTKLGRLLNEELRPS